MIKWFFSKWNRVKAKNFALFLLCSFLAWFLSNLSESYQSQAIFSIEYVNLPDALLLDTQTEKTLNVKIKASGFQLLYYRFTTKSIALNLSQLTKEGNGYYLNKTQLKRQIESQLSNRITFVDVDQEKLWVEVYKAVTREFKVLPDISIGLGQNYAIKGELKVEPKKITVKGPENELNGINDVRTVAVKLEDITGDFEKEIQLNRPESLAKSVFSREQVRVSAQIVKFSEQIFTLSIKVNNVPEGYAVRTFPNTVSVLCKASVSRLKQIEVDDFEVSAEYPSNSTAESHTLVLRLKKKPEELIDVKLMETQVEFIVEQL